MKVIPLTRIHAPLATKFLADYVRPRRPVVLDEVGANWPARNWNTEMLRREWGNESVPVAPTRDGAVVLDEGYGLARHPVRLIDYIDSLESGAPNGYLTACVDELPNAFRDAAPPPSYCRSARWQVTKFWLGGRGTISAMHRDLADNLHTVIFGRKKFTVVDPRQSACLYPNSLRASIPNGCQADIEQPDLQRFPLLDGVTLQTVELRAGETLYIPRRWWHHAHTLDLSFSVNHWWARGWWAALVTAADLFKRVRGISR